MHVSPVQHAEASLLVFMNEFFEIQTERTCVNIFTLAFFLSFFLS